MYTKYFGLTEKPFSSTPDFPYIYMSDMHREALAHLLCGIGSDDCFILVTGELGTGKTTLCRCLLDDVPAETDVALLAKPPLSTLELLEAICSEFEISLDNEEKSVKLYVDQLMAFLIKAHSDGKNAALIIDEAQNLSLELLDQLYFWANLETNNKKLLKIIFLGQPELNQIVQQPETSKIEGAITSRYHLLPLDRENSFAYVRHRLSVAGAGEEIFSKTALLRLFELSEGIPKRIDALCDRALLETYNEQQYLVTSAIVDRSALGELGSLAENQIPIPQKQSLKKPLLIVFLALIGVGIASYYWNNQKSAGVASISSHKSEKQKVVTPPGTTVPVIVVEEPEKLQPQKNATTIRIIPLEIND